MEIKGISVEVVYFIDLKYKAVPDYLLLLVFVLSFFITDFSLENNSPLQVMNQVNDWKQLLKKK